MFESDFERIFPSDHRGYICNYPIKQLDRLTRENCLLTNSIFLSHDTELAKAQPESTITHRNRERVIQLCSINLPVEDSDL